MHWHKSSKGYLLNLSKAFCVFIRYSEFHKKYMILAEFIVNQTDICTDNIKPCERIIDEFETKEEAQKMLDELWEEWLS